MYICESVRKKIQDIRLVVFDVDGVLTDGGLYYLNDGNIAKKFYVKDGTGIRRLITAGIAVAFATGLESRVVAQRAEDLGVEHIIQNSTDKKNDLGHLLSNLGLDWQQTAYVGDDIIDKEVMRAVGLPVAVADAVEEIKEVAAAVTTLPGGRGAAREFCDMLLKHHHQLD